MSLKQKVFLFSAFFFWLAAQSLFGEEPADTLKIQNEPPNAPQADSRSQLRKREEPPFVGLVTGDRVNLRAGPSLASETLFQLSKGSKVQVVVKEGSWYGIRLPDKASVYVAKGFLRMEEEGKARVQGRRVHVRAGAGQAFKSLGFLEDQEVVRIRKIHGDWAEIEPLAFCRGWVKQSYVTFLAPEQQKEISDGQDRGIPSPGTEGRQDSGSQDTSQRR